ncbi:MAG: hypothetical protein RLZZ168_879, partial [Cyanobacteriota bacterium]
MASIAEPHLDCPQSIRFMPMKRPQRSSITAALSLLSGLLLIAPAAFACG